MVVQTQERHPGHSGLVGLHIGRVNVQQYFPRDIADVELELDHLCIVCPLEPSFWQDRPEIHDFRLSSWLEAKRNSGKLAPNPAPVAMIPCGKQAFRLQLTITEELDHSLRGNTALVAAAGVVSAGYFSQTVSPAALLVSPASVNMSKVERRGRDAGRMPDRRRVARLKSDDSPSSSARN